MSMFAEEKVERLQTALDFASYTTGKTHHFYHYPARFSPEFARTIISDFSDHDQWVLDPFMRGGTSVVEGLALGRRMVGIDTPLPTPRTGSNKLRYGPSQKASTLGKPLRERIQESVVSLKELTRETDVSKTALSRHLGPAQKQRPLPTSVPSEDQEPIGWLIKNPQK